MLWLQIEERRATIKAGGCYVVHVLVQYITAQHRIRWNVIVYTHRQQVHENQNLRLQYKCFTSPNSSEEVLDYRFALLLPTLMDYVGNSVRIWELVDKIFIDSNDTGG